MTDEMTFYQNIAAEVGIIPGNTILSKALATNEKIKVTVFGFAAGQELTEHTAAYPAILHFLQGDADLTLGKEKFQATTGSWAYMPAQIPHSLVAKTPLSMLLIMLVA
jgi:quercetin dioxygenase-like cupin family protein